MPTIDELAPATAAADSDEFVTSQSGIVRKVTRSQITSGYQPMFALASGSVVGRSSFGTGSAEQISIGSNLTLNQGTLSATAAPYVIAQLANGMVPATFDLVPIGQYGENVAVSYSQFMSGLSGLSGIDLSSMTVTPSGSGNATPIGTFAANVLMRGGGTMTGLVTLAGDPRYSTRRSDKAIR